MASAVLLGLCVCVCLLGAAAKPTIYVKNENDKLEPVLVAVSSTVIPLPVYKVSYGVGVQGPKLPLPAKPDSDYKLIIVPKKKGSGKTAATPVKIIRDKEGTNKRKDTL